MKPQIEARVLEEFMWRSKVFIGCSSEARAVGEQLSSALASSGVAIPMGWWQVPEFSSMSSTLEGLMHATNVYDFGVFIFSQDDVIASRGQKSYITRDNVLLEMGMFLGRLTEKRIHIIVSHPKPGTKPVKLPSDLSGVIYLTYSNNDEHDLRSSIGNAVSDIVSHIRSTGPRLDRAMLIDSYGFDFRTRSFQVTLSKDRIERYKYLITDKNLILAMLKKSSVPAENDRSLVLGELYTRNFLETGDIFLKAEGAIQLAGLRDGEVIHAYLLAVPRNFKLKPVKCLADMLNFGCDLLQRKGFEAIDESTDGDFPHSIELEAAPPAGSDLGFGD